MVKSEMQMVGEAYKAMAHRVKYRPAAPGDGFGDIFLSKKELADPGILHREAAKYAREFIAEEDTCRFQIGCCDHSNTTAFVYAIEAAHCLCAGKGFHEIAAKLLRMAAKEVGND